MGGVVGQPQLRARAPAVRRGPDGTVPPTGVDDAVGRRGDARASRSSPRRRPAASASSAPRPRRRRDVGRPAAAAPGSSRRASTATSTGAGGGRRTATSPPARTRRGSSSEPEEQLVTDEPATPTRPPPVEEDGADADALRARPVLLADMPVGAHVGTFVHRVFEATDFAAADLDAELGRRDRRGAGAAARRHRRPAASSSTGLRAVIETPLGPLLGGARLRDVARADRLDELDFELPLAGGDDPPAASTLAAIGAVLRDDLRRAIRSPATPSASSDPALRSRVRGYLTGSIDLVVRCAATASPSSTTRRTGSARPARTLSAWHHRPAALAAEMQPVALRAAGAALHRRAAPLPALAAARLRPRAQPRGRAVPVPARHGRARRRRWSTARRAACSPGGRRPRSWSR